MKLTESEHRYFEVPENLSPLILAGEDPTLNSRSLHCRVRSVDANRRSGLLAIKVVLYRSLDSGDVTRAANETAKRKGVGSARASDNEDRPTYR
jgi:hypothetical protein